MGDCLSYLLHTGRKAGFLGSAYFIGNFVGSLVWGWLADVLGRRPVLLLGVCGIISCRSSSRILKVSNEVIITCVMYMYGMQHYIIMFIRFSA